MNCKKVIVSVLLFMMLSLALTRSTIAELEETRTVYQLEYGNLTVEIKAPYEADLGDEINVTVRVGATDVINVKEVFLSIYGLKNETVEVLLGGIRITDLEGSYNRDEIREYVYNITVLEEISPGLTYGTITCEWTCMGGILTLRIPSAGFIVTYVGNKELEQLRVTYEELNASYWELNSNYTELNSTYTELEEKHSASSGALAGARNLMYAFVATTAVSAATAVFLFIRKPKEKWE